MTVYTITIFVYEVYSMLPSELYCFSDEWLFYFCNELYFE